MAQNKTSCRKRLEAAPKLKRWDYNQSTGVSTRSSLRDLLFNNG